MQILRGQTCSLEKRSVLNWRRTARMIIWPKEDYEQNAWTYTDRDRNMHSWLTMTDNFKCFRNKRNTINGTCEVQWLEDYIASSRQSISQCGIYYKWYRRTALQLLRASDWNRIHERWNIQIIRKCDENYLVAIKNWIQLVSEQQMYQNDILREI